MLAKHSKAPETAAPTRTHATAVMVLPRVWLDIHRAARRCETCHTRDHRIGSACVVVQVAMAGGDGEPRFSVGLVCAACTTMVTPVRVCPSVAVLWASLRPLFAEAAATVRSGRDACNTPYGVKPAYLHLEADKCALCGKPCSGHRRQSWKQGCVWTRIKTCDGRDGCVAQASPRWQAELETIRVATVLRRRSLGRSVNRVEGVAFPAISTITDRRLLLTNPVLLE
ncbi:hypothetical protein QKT49_gp442 [Acanthamoeba castellanii medusavirus]|uniref:Uncharacterized protein n=1 Tax=Acanthamoeba castellanii medusavirus J1 TaxID=3114988 RepID=A0A3T1CWX1_9VIRU|nr:hypothetical protein QKT49_gp442 [Acanthamoeba castellanii medusavirus]BBI30321.1 hypothetical protein [Acanthamoeba castellanii medusavirus J1]